MDNTLLRYRGRAVTDADVLFIRELIGTHRGESLWALSRRPLVNTALQSKPRGKTHWSRRDLAAESGLSKSTVHRYMTLFGLQPHRSKSFKLSNDPFFIEKIRDVVGLYLNPPDHALVLCVDEKSQVRALGRTQPVQPMGLGYVEGIKHDYIGHGTTTL